MGINVHERNMINGLHKAIICIIHFLLSFRHSDGSPMWMSCTNNEGKKKRKTLPAFVVLSFFILTGGFTNRPVEPFSPDVTSYEGNPPPAQQKEFEVRQKKWHYLWDIFWSINTQTPLDLDSFMKELNTRPLKVKKLLYIKVSNSGPRPKTTSCSYHQIKHEIILKNFPKIN